MAGKIQFGLAPGVAVAFLDGECQDASVHHRLADSLECIGELCAIKVQQHCLGEYSFPGAAQLGGTNVEQTGLVASRAHHLDERRRRIGARHVKPASFEVRRVHAWTAADLQYATESDGVSEEIQEGT